MNTDQKAVAFLRSEIGNEWVDPPVMDCWTFLITEAAEVGDALLRMGQGQGDGYARNTDKEPDLEAEMGDVQLMLCSLANKLGIDLTTALDKRINHFYDKFVGQEVGNGNQS